MRGINFYIPSPPGLTRIESDAFYYCTALRQITFPQGLITIADEAFIGCEKLQQIVLPESICSIAYEAFKYCSIDSVFINSLNIEQRTRITQLLPSHCRRRFCILQ
ncbi:leucine-rich repeat domain-containing protein [Legionella hackeliae]|uniref:leucine-rich repeat domain-containing protein n=1 Tax=Legionella hackeliae TaxID=449 RepID=UPI0005D40EFC